MKINKIILAGFLLFSAFLSAQSEKDKDIKKDKKIKTVLIPTVTYNNSFKTVFGAMASGFYHINKADTISPISSSSLIGTYSLNDTWYLIQPNKFYFKENKFRSKVVVGTGSINFQTYFDWGDVIGNLPPGIFPDPPSEGAFIDYNNRFYFLFTDF